MFPMLNNSSSKTQLEKIPQKEFLVIITMLEQLKKQTFILRNFGSQIEYVGFIRNGKEHGEGKYTYDNGDVFIGLFNNGSVEGKGKFLHSNGDVYEGEYENFTMSGKGKYFFNCGDVYDGDWVDSMMDGKGTFVFENGDKYVGDWKDDNKHGKGVYFCESGKYEGEYKEGERNGYGNWKDGTREGYGSMFYNGNRYTGGWKDGKLHGKGIYTHNGKMKGNGVFHYNNGSNFKILIFEGNIYSGMWKEDMRKGFGKFIYPNGSKFEGEWNDCRTKGRFFGKTFYFDGDWEGVLVSVRDNETGTFYYKIFEGELVDRETGEVIAKGKWEEGINKDLKRENIRKEILDEIEGNSMIFLSKKIALEVELERDRIHSDSQSQKKKNDETPIFE